MVNSKTPDDSDDDSSEKEQAVRPSMPYGGERMEGRPSPYSEKPDDEGIESDDWECAKCGYGEDIYEMDELNAVYETAGGKEIHYGCRKNV